MKTNRAYKEAITAEDRYLILYGGAGSGKSYFTAQKILNRCDSTPGERFLVLRKVHRTIKGSTFQLFRDVIAAERFECAINRSEYSIRFPNGSEIVHAGLDDVEKLKSIAGVTSVWIEEATELIPADFDQINLRLRGKVPTYKQIVISFNPVSARHWLKAKFFDEMPEGCRIIKTTYTDNAFIDSDYSKILESLPEDLKMVYARGEWGIDVRGLIYPIWTTYRLPADRVDAYGLDFGFNAPSALVSIEVTDPEIKVREMLCESHLTNSDLIQRLETLVPDKSVPIYCDNAEPARIEEMIRAGFQAYAADKSVNDGIDTVKRYKLVLHTDSQELMNEIREYKWDENKKTGESIDKPLKRNDHLMDAMRYAIHSHCAETVAKWGMW